MAIDYDKLGAIPDNQASNGGGIDYSQFGEVKEPEKPTAHGLLYKLNQAAGSFNNVIENDLHLPALAEGLLQGTGDVASSLGNIPIDLYNRAAGQNVPRIPSPHLDKYIEDTAGNQVAQFGGKALPYLLPASRIDSAVKTGLEKFPNLANYAKNIISGGAAGAAVGADDQGNRGLGAVIGGGVPAVGGVAKAGYQLLDNPLANSILRMKNKMQDVYSTAYDKLFAQSKNVPNLTNGVIPTGNIDYDLINSNILRKYRPAIQDFQENPTFENAHKAQSDIGKLVRYFEDAHLRKNPLSSSQISLLDHLHDSQQFIRNGMANYLDTSGNPQLAKDYKNLTAGYAKDVIPYSRNANLTKYQNGQMDAKTFVQKALKDYEFKTDVASKNPELARRAMVGNLYNNKLVRLLGTGALIGTGFEGGKLGIEKLFK